MSCHRMSSRDEKNDTPTWWREEGVPAPPYRDRGDSPNYNRNQGSKFCPRGQAEL